MTVPLSSVARLKRNKQPPARTLANAIAIGIDHKQAEERLRVTNAEMQALFAAMDEVILVRDRLGRVLKIPKTRRNPVWHDPNELIGKLPATI